MAYPEKLETGLRTISAGIPYALLLRIEAMGLPTFWWLTTKRSPTQPLTLNPNPKVPKVFEAKRIPKKCRKSGLKALRDAGGRGKSLGGQTFPLPYALDLSCRTISGTQKGTLIQRTAHMSKGPRFRDLDGAVSSRVGL